MYRINILPDQLIVEVEEGTDLLAAEIKAGLSPDAPCGGNGTCGKCQVDIINEDGSTESVLACQYIVDKDLTIRTHEDEKDTNILEVGEMRAVAVAPQVKEGYGAAFDIGTTTVVCYLLDLRTGKELARASMQNPQRQFGADVISRCEYALENGVETLSKVIREALNDLIAEVCAEASGAEADNAKAPSDKLPDGGEAEGKITPEDVRLVTVVGNTCMHHLFMNILPDTLAVVPYEAKVKDEIVMPAKDADIHIHPDGILQVLPNIAGFVGADTIGCMLAIEFDKLDEMTLMIDIGTNGEMVMGNKDRMIACSAAAGPAFEGARLDCGMRGADGAIDHVRIEGDEIVCHIIGADAEERSKGAETSKETTDSTGGNKEASESKSAAIGICGSGLLDAVADSIDAEIIDETGQLDTDNVHVFKLPDSEMPAIRLTEKVHLSQKDIQEAQLAKGAIGAGIELLAKHLGIEISDINTVMIAGAFGNYMNPHSACRIGMIPAELEDKVQMIGNAAGVGSIIATLNYDEFLRAQKLREKAEFLELASDPDFQDTFVDNLMFE